MNTVKILAGQQHEKSLLQDIHVHHPPSAPHQKGFFHCCTDISGNSSSLCLPRTPAALLGDWYFQSSWFCWMQCPALWVCSRQANTKTLDWTSFHLLCLTFFRPRVGNCQKQRHVIASCLHTAQDLSLPKYSKEDWFWLSWVTDLSEAVTKMKAITGQMATASQGLLKSELSS